MWVHELADADATCGGKALGIAALVRAQLPVPRGFVIDDRAFRHVAGELALDDLAEARHVLAAAAERIASAALPEAFVREVERRAAELGTLAVRSSATIEDGAAGAAAGVFSSRTAVPAAEVWAAIRAVWTSALTPLAAAYARRRGGTISIGVIVQAFELGQPITIYTRPPGAPGADELLAQVGTGLVRIARSGPVASELDLPRELALRAEAALGAQAGADLELVVAPVGTWLVQARPIVHPVARARVAAPPPVLAALVADGRRWTWDVAHNPDPLSTAQTELVELVERARIGPAMRVCAGYLYTAARSDAAAPGPPDLSSAEAVRARVADIEERLAALLDGTPARAGIAIPAPTSLAEARERYVAAIAIWAHELSPLVRALPRTPGAHRPSAVETTLAAAARGELSEGDVLARIGVLSPAWDVAVPTYAERPELVRAAIERARGIAPPQTRDTDLAADLAERDDVWFAKAQWLVRRALLARADALAIDRQDVCWLPFELLERGVSFEDARRHAAAARAANERAARWSMPLVVPPDASETHGRTLRGVGSGPRVTGRVVRYASLASAIAVGRGDIIVSRAVTPALAVMVIGCAALVCETGGLLDHGAALARELGIPCVVGCHDAWSILADGMLVSVDGDAGQVEIVGNED